MKVHAWVKMGRALIKGSFFFGAALMVFQLLNLDGGIQVSFFSVLPYYLLFGCVLFEIIMNVSVYQSYVPMCLSFGSTRRDIKWGIHIMMLMPAAAVVLFSAVFCLLVKNDITSGILTLLPAAFFALIFLSSVCSTAGCISTKYKAGKWLVFIVTLIGSGAVGFSAAYSITDMSVPAVTVTWTLTAAVAAAALVMTAVELTVQKRMIGSYEVKL